VLLNKRCRGGGEGGGISPAYDLNNSVLPVKSFYRNHPLTTNETKD